MTLYSTLCSLVLYCAHTVSELQQNNNIVGNDATVATRMASAAANLKHGLLGEFRAGVENIDDYNERFELYCLPNAVAMADEHVARKKAIFLTSVGASTYSLLRTLVRPRQPQDLELDDII